MKEQQVREYPGPVAFQGIPNTSGTCRFALMDIALITGSILLLLAGFVFSVLPPLPGPPIAWGALLCLRWHSTSSEPDYGWTAFLLLWLVIAIASTFLDNLLAVWGTKLTGGSKAGTWGAFLGLIVGLLFLGPLGILIGPFAGAFLFEIASGRDFPVALKSGLGSLAGFVAGTLLKVGITICILILWLRLLL